MNCDRAWGGKNNLRSVGSRDSRPVGGSRSTGKSPQSGTLLDLGRLCGLPGASARIGLAAMANGRNRKMRRAGLVLLVVLGAGLGTWKWVTRDKPRYEAAFAEYIWVAFPPGYPMNGTDFGGPKIDEILRERKMGYLGGVAGVGDPPEVVEVELAVDLNVLEAKALVEEFQEMGLLPAEATYEAGKYPRSWPED